MIPTGAFSAVVLTEWLSMDNVAEHLRSLTVFTRILGCGKKTRGFFGVDGKLDTIKKTDPF